MRRGSAEHVALRQGGGGGGSPRSERRASGSGQPGPDRIERQSNFKVGILTFLRRLSNSDSSRYFANLCDSGWN